MFKLALPLLLTLILVTAPLRQTAIAGQGDSRAINAALTALQESKAAHALKLLESILSRKDPPIHALLIAGNAYIHQDAYTKALSLFSKGAELYPEHAGMLQNKAIAFYYLEQFANAATCFLKAAQLAKLDAQKDAKAKTAAWRQNHYQAAACFYKAEKYTKARNAILPILSDNTPQSFTATLKLYAHIELALENWKEATSALQQLIANTPQDAKSWKLLAETYLRTDALGKAASALQVAYSITAPTASEQTRLARIFLQIDAPLLACKTLEKIPSPLTASQYKLLAIGHERSGNTAGAITALQKAVSLDNSVKSNMELGKLLYRSCQYQEAIAPLSTAANQMKKKKGMAYYLIGQCYMHVENLEKSKTFFEKALRYKSVKANAQNALRMIEQLSQTRMNTKI